MDASGQATSKSRQKVRARADASRIRRDQILKAGLELFLEHGVGATTVGEILERSGASIGSFYHHFGSRAEVAAAIFLETLDRYERSFLIELNKHDQARSGVESAVRWHLRWVATQSDLAGYLTHCREPEVTSLSEGEARHLNRTFYEGLLKWLSRHVDAGEIRKLPSHLYFALWMGPANEFTRQWLMSDDRDPRRISRAESLLAGAGWAALRADS